MRSLLYLTFSLVVGRVSPMYSSKSMEGYPNALMSDCPGSTKPAIITPSSLKNLFMIVQGPGQIYLAPRSKRYTYYQVKQLAKDPMLDFSKKTVLFVIGYLDSTNNLPSWVMGKYYKDLDYNVLVLDTNFFTTIEYPVAARMMRPVGFHTAEMLANLTKLGLDPKHLEIVGISLGGQTISFIGKNFQKLTGRNISRITALDPAGPCFRNLGPEDRLDQSDGDFVEVIQTNIDGYGMAAPVGHVNFYVNGGEFQPGDFLWMFCNVLCSHVRSFTLWMSALQNPKSFIALQCDSVQQARERKCYDRKPRVTNLLGHNCDKSVQGIFYLSTDNNFPYYLGKKGLLKENDFIESHLKVVNDDDLIKMK